MRVRTIIPLILGSRSKDRQAKDRYNIILIYKITKLQNPDYCKDAARNYFLVSETETETETKPETCLKLRNYSETPETSPKLPKLARNSPKLKFGRNYDIVSRDVTPISKKGNFVSQ